MTAVKIHAEPRPLHSPLPGGQKGATVVVEPLIAGSVNWPMSMMERPGGRLEKAKIYKDLFAGGEHRVPCPAFLIRHPTAGPVMVDTGLHPSVSSDPKENFGRAAARISSPELEPGHDVPAQLRARGISMGEVSYLVMTHLHMDHASAISEFEQSQVIVTETEWEAATNDSRPSLRGYRPEHYDYAFDYRTLDYDRASIGSYATFGRTFDLFGDGSIRLAYTPGHSAGHQCVIAKLKDTEFVIGGDCVYTTRQIEEERVPMPPAPVDEHRFRRSLQELKLFRREFPDAIITPGHDPEFYANLGERYE